MGALIVLVIYFQQKQKLEAQKIEAQIAGQEAALLMQALTYKQQHAQIEAAQTVTAKDWMNTLQSIGTAVGAIFSK